MESQSGDDRLSALSRANGLLELDDYGSPTREPNNHDQQPHYTHELSPEAAETATRVLVRIVPLAFGALLGDLADSFAIGMAIAVAVSVAFDLSMEDKSMLHSLYRQIRNR